jgi:hypothetical protein
LLPCDRELHAAPRNAIIRNYSPDLKILVAVVEALEMLTGL